MLISDELERTLKRAFERAKASRHEFIAPEHLLYALTYDAVASNILFHCGADVEDLRREVDEFLEESMPAYPVTSGARGAEKTRRHDPQYTLGAQFVLQLAATNVQSAGKSEIDGGNVLAALFRDKESHAVYLLGRQSVSRLDVLALHLSRRLEARRAKAHRGRSERAGAATSSTSARADVPESADEVLARYCVESQRQGRRRQDRSARRSQGRARARRSHPRAHGERTTRSSSATPGVGQDRDRRGPGAPHSRRRRARVSDATARSTRSTWPACSPARAIAAISKSA